MHPAIFINCDRRHIIVAVGDRRVITMQGVTGGSTDTAAMLHMAPGADRGAYGTSPGGLVAGAGSATLMATGTDGAPYRLPAWGPR